MATDPSATGQVGDPSLSREEFDRSLVERIQEQYLAGLKRDDSTGEFTQELSSTDAEFEASALDPPWKPLSPLTNEEHFKGRFEKEAKRAIEDLGNGDESPESDDGDSSFV